MRKQTYLKISFSIYIDNAMKELNEVIQYTAEASQRAGSPQAGRISGAPPLALDKRPLVDRLALALIATQNKYSSEQERAAAILALLQLEET